MRTRLVVRRAQLISNLCWQQTSDCVIINFISLFHVTLSTRPYWKSKQHCGAGLLGSLCRPEQRNVRCCFHWRMCRNPLTKWAVVSARRPLSFTRHKTNSRRIKQKTVNLNKNFSRLVLKALLLFILADSWTLSSHVFSPDTCMLIIKSQTSRFIPKADAVIKSNFYPTTFYGSGANFNECIFSVCVTSILELPRVDLHSDTDVVY